MSRRANEDVSRLPQWAQRRIQALESSVASLESKLAEGPESNTYADPYSVRRPLGVDSTIEFVLSQREDGSRKDYLMARLDNGRLHLMGNDMIAVYPQSGNVVLVKSERFR